MRWRSVCDDALLTAEEKLDARAQEMYEGMTDSAFGGSKDKSMPQKATWRRAARTMRQLTHST
eukprot:3219677-Rhodomonas_salina.1